MKILINFHILSIDFDNFTIRDDMAQFVAIHVHIIKIILFKIMSDNTIRHFICFI